ncbi:AraC family transcriptional regulator [Pendulispora albinea]|uniref:AraC family transcriptional regulator n=1 Tax=Pendulispora albinea TaxID=2741071 RepID=A0ABZ2M2B5_9BACT
MHDRSSDAPLPPDPLSEVLQDLRLSGVAYGRCELTRPWGIDFPPQRSARFHFVASGECWLRPPASALPTAGGGGAKRGRIRLGPGDVALLPLGAGHELTDTSRGGGTKSIDDLPLEEIGDRTYVLREGGGGAETLLFCGSVNFEEPAVHPLLELMPKVLLVRDAAKSDATLPVLLETMASEVRTLRVGAATVLTRLTEVVITRVIRAWVEGRSEDATGWLAAIRDPKIGLALAAIHRHPGRPWSVESLADVAQTSRSMFSERFTAVVGTSPARYLARWRMHVASGWLRSERLTVSEAASRLGYDSEASFSRAFKRVLGVPPSELRRIGREDRAGVARTLHARAEHHGEANAQ